METYFWAELEMTMTVRAENEDNANAIIEQSQKALHDEDFERIKLLLKEGLELSFSERKPVHPEPISVAAQP